MTATARATEHLCLPSSSHLIVDFPQAHRYRLMLRSSYWTAPRASRQAPKTGRPRRAARVGSETFWGGIRWLRSAGKVRIKSILTRPRRVARLLTSALLRPDRGRL